MRGAEFETRGKKDKEKVENFQATVNEDGNKENI